MSAEYIADVLVRGGLFVAGIFLVLGFVVLWFVCAMAAIQGWAENRRQAALYHAVTWGPFVLFFGVAFVGPPR